MVSMSASVNLPLHHKVQKFSSGTGSHQWSQKKGRKTVVVVVVVLNKQWQSINANHRETSYWTAHFPDPLTSSG